MQYCCINVTILLIVLEIFALRRLSFSIFAGMKPAEINAKWAVLQNKIAEEFDNEKPDMKVMLFLVGVQELGQGPRKFSKRQKKS